MYNITPSCVIKHVHSFMYPLDTCFRSVVLHHLFTARWPAILGPESPQDRTALAKRMLFYFQQRATWRTAEITYWLSAARLNSICNFALLLMRLFLFDYYLFTDWSWVCSVFTPARLKTKFINRFTLPYVYEGMCIVNGAWIMDTWVRYWWTNSASTDLNCRSASPQKMGDCAI